MLLRDWLNKHDLTITDLALRLGCSRAAASYWLAGKTRPSPKHTLAIQRLTQGNVTADDLQSGWELEN
ncbi:DNA-binding protein [uncultured Mediterranean phage uvDeep-CGR0-AD1-C123]|nr:DNA-binding protein [uncultured Mediterranean phage uvDeep-CGR0-AD1-C123]